MKHTSIIRPWMLGLALPIITFCAYIPAMRTGGFIWDDDAHVYKNPTLLSLNGLHDIWLKISATQQYYPMVFSSFWFEHRVFGFWPAGYHIDNAILHALSALLLWRIFERLELPGAWLAAALFALHPLNVESVAWISERKNVLCGFFLMLFGRAYIRFAMPEQFHPDDELSEFESSAVYIWAFMVFLCALFSKTVACTAPAAMLLIIWWKRGKLTINDCLRALPFFVVGVLAGWLTSYLERGQIGARGQFFDLTPPDRVIIAGRALWFYAAKFFLPARLIFFYPHWNINAHQIWQFAFPLSAAGLLIATWTLRRRIGRGPVTALLYFGGTLAPALGFVNVYPMRFSYVADHFSYLAIIGLAALTGAAMARVFKNIGGVQHALVGGIILFLFARVTLAQQAIYQNEEVLWTRTIELNNHAAAAYTNLGKIYDTQRRFDLAEPLFQRAVELTPDDPTTLYNLGHIYVETARPELAVPQFTRAVEVAPRYAEAHEQLGQIQRLQGDEDAAIHNFQMAILYYPRNPQPYFQLSQILDARGDFAGAVRALQTTAHITPYGPTHYNLAMLYMRHGDRARAELELQETLRIQPNFEAARDALNQLEREPDLPQSPAPGPP